MSSESTSIESIEERLVLLNPGPACTTDRVRAALGGGDLCHRESEFGELLQRIRAGLTRCLNVGDTHEALLITGSGTSAMEMAVISSVRAGRAVLVVNNGVYGDRLLKIARCNGITAYEVKGEWTRPIDVEAVRAALAEHDDVDALVCVHHETTTGMINPIRELGELVADTGTLFVIDAISGTGNEDQDLGEVRADIICGTANKGLHGLPGISFLLVSNDKGIGRITEVPQRSLYLNAATYLAGQRSGNVPFTPAVQVCYALDEAIKEFEESGGFAARVAAYRERADLLRKGFENLGLKILVEEPYRSNSVTMIYLPEGVTYDALHDELKRRGYVIYAGQGQLSDEFFRVCNMGELPLPVLERFLTDLEQALEVVRA
ncbi:MAG TPA: aminotransferase class V-fold PLP-dependent enzyme [Kribbellaceae bacterium]